MGQGSIVTNGAAKRWEAAGQLCLFVTVGNILGVYQYYAEAREIRELAAQDREADISAQQVIEYLETHPLSSYDNYRAVYDKILDSNYLNRPVCTHVREHLSSVVHCIGDALRELKPLVDVRQQRVESTLAAIQHNPQPMPTRDLTRYWQQAFDDLLAEDKHDTQVFVQQIIGLLKTFEANRRYYLTSDETAILRPYRLLLITLAGLISALFSIRMHTRALAP